MAESNVQIGLERGSFDPKTLAFDRPIAPPLMPAYITLAIGVKPKTIGGTAIHDDSLTFPLELTSYGIALFRQPIVWSVTDSEDAEGFVQTKLTTTPDVLKL